MKLNAIECNGESGLIPLQRWLAELGVSTVTAWRWRKRGYFQTVNIAGRNYIARSTIRKFEERATRGEFSMASGVAKVDDENQTREEG